MQSTDFEEKIKKKEIVEEVEEGDISTLEELKSKLDIIDPK
jgi:hypothetical protein